MNANPDPTCDVARRLASVALPEFAPKSTNVIAASRALHDDCIGEVCKMLEQIMQYQAASPSCTARRILTLLEKGRDDASD